MSEQRRVPRAGHVCFPACDERVEAQAAGLFFYHVQLGGFVFTDRPKRRMDYAAKIRMEATLPAERDYTDHTDEPYVWHECPFCGADLPSLGGILDYPLDDPPPANPEE